MKNKAIFPGGNTLQHEDTQARIEAVVKRKKIRNRIQRAVALLCAAAVLLTLNTLKLDADTLERIPMCGLEEHAHGEECYPLICGLEQRDPLTAQKSVFAERFEVHRHTTDCLDDNGNIACGRVEGEYYHVHSRWCYDAQGHRVCGLDEKKPHEHTEACWQDVATLTCLIEETPAHAHDESCYASHRALRCGLEESAGHAHTDACYTHRQTLSCGLEETSGHHHTDACYVERSELACGRSESDGHRHTSDCYSRVLSCGLSEGEEHTHDGSCYSEVLSCGQSEGEGAHHHDDSCYRTVRELGCSKAEGEGAHAHSEACYTLSSELTCGLNESAGHTHTDACYETTLELICPLEETEGHTHTDACYTHESVLACGKDMAINIAGRMGLESVTLHHHTDRCFYEATRKDAFGRRYTVVLVGCGCMEVPEFECTAQSWETQSVVVDPGHAHTAACRDLKAQPICGLEAHVHTDACFQQRPVKSDAQQDEAISTELSSDESIEGTAFEGGASADEPADAREGTDEVMTTEAAPASDEDPADEGGEEIVSDTGNDAALTAASGGSRVLIEPVEGNRLPEDGEIAFEAQDGGEALDRVLEYLNGSAKPVRFLKAAKAAPKAAEESYTHYAVFDIALLSGGEPVDETGAVRVSVMPEDLNVLSDLPEGARVQEIRYALYHVHGDAVEALDVDVAEQDGVIGRFSFETDAFSSFVLSYTVTYTYQDQVFAIGLDFTGFEAQPGGDVVAALNQGVSVDLAALLDPDAAAGDGMTACEGVAIEGDADIYNDVDFGALALLDARGGLDWQDGRLRITGDGTIGLSDGVYALNIAVTGYTETVAPLCVGLATITTAEGEGLSVGASGHADIVLGEEAVAAVKALEGEREDAAYTVFDISTDAVSEDGFRVSLVLPEGIEGRDFRLYHLRRSEQGELIPEALDAELLMGEAETLTADAAPGDGIAAGDGEAEAAEDEVDNVMLEGLSFTTDSFSEFVLSYTVDFHGGIDGAAFEFSLPGGGFVRLSELIEALGLAPAAEDAPDGEDPVERFISNVEDVVFSTPELIWIGKIDADITVGELKALNGLEVEYSAELTRDEIDAIDAQIVKAGDWVLISLKPFTTEETLTITMVTGEVYVIAVTDGQIKKTIISDSGDTWEITVTYGDDAMIPEGAELVVREILPEDEDYDAYFSEAADRALTDAQSRGIEAPVITGARPFDIEIRAEGVKIEPAAPVQVSIRLIGETADMLSVIHFAEDGAETMALEGAEAQTLTAKEPAATDEASDDQAGEGISEACFEAVSFSVYTVVSVDNSTDLVGGGPWALVTGVSGDPGATTGYSETWGRDYFTIIVNAEAMHDSAVVSQGNEVAYVSQGVHAWTDGTDNYVGGDAPEVWYFERVPNSNKYYIYVLRDGVKYYIDHHYGNQATTSLSTQWRTEFDIDRNSDGTVCIHNNNWYLGNNGNGEWGGRDFRFTQNPNTSESWFRFRLCKQSDDFDSFAAQKVAASTVTTNANYVIYRKFEDESGNEALYALAHDGTFVRVYDGGDTIYWRETDKNIYWNYQMDGRYPVLFTQDPATNQFIYINPNHSEGQMLSTTVGDLTLLGRDNGEYSTAIEKWDQAAYDYAGLHVIQNSDGTATLSTGTRVAGTSDEFLFAVASQMPGATAETVATVDSDSLGIKITMFDYGDWDGNYNAGDKLEEMTDIAGSADYTPHAAHALVKPYLESGVPSGVNGAMTGLFSSGGAIKSSMSNVNHLFLQSYYDESGTFRYRSEDNYAYLPFSNGQITGTDFTVYRQAATPYTSDNSPGHTYYHHGHFMPFNDIDMNNNLSRLMNQYGNEYTNGTVVGELPIGDGRTYEDIYGVQGIPNFYTGMKMEANFSQPRSGKLENGDDMIFKFSGDDDMWVYIDGVLVLDIGGIHEPLSGTINFATGVVTNPTGSSLAGTTTLYQIFQDVLHASGTPQSVKDKINDIAWKDVNGDGTPDTFADYTNHSFGAFYMERGAGASNLDIQFNLKVVLSNQFTVEKEIPEDVDDRFDNQIYKFQATYMDGTTEKPLRAGIANVCNAVVYKGTNDPVEVDENGYFYLKAGEAAVFMMADESIRYNVREVDLDQYNLEKITINDNEVTDHVEINDQQAAIIDNAAVAGYDEVGDRSNVLYTNYPKTQNLRITKHIDEDSAPMEPGENPVFEFRVYLETTITGEDGNPQRKLVPYSYGPYYLVKEVDGVVHYYTLTGANNAPVDKGTEPVVCSTTGRSGSINSIPPEYTIIIPNLVVGTNFYLEERRDNMPAGYEFVREELTEGTYDENNFGTDDEIIHRVLARDETDHQEFDHSTVGRIKNDVDAESHVYNRKPAVIITVEKQWEPQPDEANASVTVELRRYAKITRGSISVTLYDNYDAPIEGAVFELYRDGQATGTRVTTDVNGIASVTGLEPGSYKLVQVSTPAAYTMDGYTTQTDTLTVVDGLTTPQILNERLTNGALRTAGKVTLTLTDSGAGSGTAGAPIQGAQFALYKDGAVLSTGHTTDAEGKVVVGNLGAGEYYLVQTSAADDYNLPNVTRTQSFTVQESPGTVQTFDLSMSNSLKGRGSVSLTLTKEGGGAISGATFQLKSGSTVLETAQTGSDGTLSFETALYEGTYTVHQVDTGSAGNAYATAADQAVTIAANSVTDQEKNLTFVNGEANGNVTIKLWRKQGANHEWNWACLQTYGGLKAGQQYTFTADLSSGLYPNNVWFYSDAQDHQNGDSISQTLLSTLDSSHMSNDNTRYTFIFTPQQDDTTYSLVLVTGWGDDSIRSMEMVTAPSVTNTASAPMRSFSARARSMPVLRANGEAPSAIHTDASPAAAPSGYATDTDFVETYTLTAADNWKHTFDAQDKFDPDGNPYYYYIVETAHTPAKYWIESYDGDGTNGSGTITVTNKYEASGSAQLSAKKAENATLGDRKFSFVLAKEDGTVIETVRNVAAGETVSFAALNYNLADVGSHVYRIYEEILEDAVSATDASVTYGAAADKTGRWIKDGVTYDGSVHTVTVTVIDNEDGTLSAKYNGADTFTVPVLENSYDATGSATFTAKKTLDGAPLTAGAYTFVLLNGEDTVLATAQNAADGSVTFDYTAAYTLSDVANSPLIYTIREVIPAGATAENGYTVYDGNTATVYDPHAATVTVRLRDNGNGTLDVQKQSDPAVEGADAAFENEQFVNVPVDKTWAFAEQSGIVTVDATDESGRKWPRGVSVSVALYKTVNDVETLEGKMLTLDADHTSGAFEHLPLYEGEYAVSYSVKETGVTGVDADRFITAISGNAQDGYTITNTEKEAGLTVTKSFTGDTLTDAQKAGITFTVKGPGLPAEGLSKTYGEFTGGSWTLNQADGILSGKTYEVTESNADVTPQYTRATTIKVNEGETVDATQSLKAEVAIDPITGTGVIAVTNDYTLEKTQIGGTKVWVDKKEHTTETNADSVTLTLRRTADAAITDQTQWEIVTGVTPTWEGNAYRFTGLDKYKRNSTPAESDDGFLYTYSVVETPIEGYQTSYEGDKDYALDNGQIINTELTQISAKKTWNGAEAWKEGMSVTFRLRRDDADFDIDEAGAQTYGAQSPVIIASQQTVTWSNLPRYHLVENEVTEYTYSVTETAVLYNGQTLETPYTTVYTVTGEGVGKNGLVTIDNADATTDVDVTKAWASPDDLPAGSCVKVLLSAKVGESDYTLTDVVTAQTLSATTEPTAWYYKWTGLPKYDAAGRLITYAVTETAVKIGSEAEVTGEALSAYQVAPDQTDDEYSFHLKNKIPPVERKALKQWNQQALPENVSVTLKITATTATQTEDIFATLKTAYQIPEDQEQTLTGTDASIAADWMAAWTNLPKYYRGEEVVYTVTETGYKIGDKRYPAANADATPAEGYDFSFTNDLPKISIEGEKRWVATGTLPEDLTIRLFAGDTKVTLNTTDEAAEAYFHWTDKEDADWHYEILNLPQYDAAGQPISYRVQEVVPEGYRADNDGKAGVTGDVTGENSGSVLTAKDLVNTELTQISGQKIWLDGTGAALTESIQEVTLKLTRAPAGTDWTDVTVTLDGAADAGENLTTGELAAWAYTWAGLDKSYRDEAGANCDYVYTVVETQFKYDGVTYTVTKGDSGYTVSPDTLHTWKTTGTDENGAFAFTNKLDDTHIDVVKLWSINGGAAQADYEAAPQRVRFKLYRKTEGESGSGTLIDPETLRPAAGEDAWFVITRQGGKWEMHIDPLPRSDANDKLYTYYLVEESLPGYAPTPRIMLKDTDTAVTGASPAGPESTIEMTNSTFTVTLPSTGGFGAGRVAALGGALALLALAGLALKKRRRDRDE